MAGPKKSPVAAEPVDPEILAAREKLKMKMGVTQTGGKGSVRRGLFVCFYIINKH